MLEDLQIKHPLIYRDATIDIYMEEHPIFVNIIHCISKQWSKSVALHYMNVLDLVIEQYNIKHLYCAVKDKKLRKFAEIYGFTPTNRLVEDTDGNRREIMQCLI